MSRENSSDHGQKGTQKGTSKTAGKSTPRRKFQKYSRPRGGEARSISDLMPEIGRAAFRRFGFIQSSVVSRWPEIVGTRYADVSVPESIRFPMGKKEDGTLNLLVSGAHATLMQHITPEIIERVNRFFGYRAISQVRFRQGTISGQNKGPSHTPDQDKKKGTAPPSLKPQPIMLSDSLRDIGDPELNRVLESLATSVSTSDGPPKIGKNEGKSPDMKPSGGKKEI